MRKYQMVSLAALGLIVVVTVVIVFIFIRNDARQFSENTLIESSDSILDIVESVADSTPQPSPAGTAQRIAWFEVRIEDVVQSVIPKYKEEVANAKLVRLASDMHEWQQNDTVHIHLPQTGDVFSVTIEQVKTSLGTNRSYKATIQENDREYSLLITVGEKNVFANFSTSKGSFELVGNTRYAWLMPTENMDQHVDYSVDDYFIPEQPRRMPEHPHEHE